MCVSVYLDGRRPDFQTDERARVAELVGRLHAFSPAPTSTPRWELPLLATAIRQLLETLGASWSEGPYGEPARSLLTRSAEGIQALLAHFEQLSDRLVASDEPWVVTHGEPHAGDVLELFRADWCLGAVLGAWLFQQPHQDTTDTAARWRDLHHYLPVEQNWPGVT